ncbi:hypothetical protein WJU23_03745 [Prosthecobacter sp. SYSU 5D2]|uniref:hypothetical protein n=1 Tax=Prosthecobacter sp. SYSU 5D2 TaxID=3134134 RepID=UPI0031FE7AAE
MAAHQKSPSKARTDTSQIPLAEWIVSAFGLLLVAATVGYMGYAALTLEDSPPDIQVEIVSVLSLRDGYLAQFRAINHGGQAANDVNIHGEHGQGPDKEESQAVVDFLPAGSEKGGGLFFRRQPAPDGVTVRATGYQEP